MDDLWTERDLPVLRAYVEHFDDPHAHRSKIDLTAATGLTGDQITRALHALGRADPPYLNIARDYGGVIKPSHVLGVTERAYRAVGVWPTAEGLADSIAAAFSQAADAEPNPEQKFRLKTVAIWLAGAGRDIAIDVLKRYVERQIPGIS